MSFTRWLPAAIMIFVVCGKAAAQDGDPVQGKIDFQQSCAICHSNTPGSNNTLVTKLGPSLVGVMGRRAASVPNYNYSQALTGSGMTWDAATLDRFLASPSAAVPGTTMPITVADAKQRQDLIAYLATLKFPDKGH